MKTKLSLSGFIFFLILLATYCTSSGKTPVYDGLVSLDEALAGAATDMGSRVQGKTEIAVAGLDAPLNEVSDFLTDELNTYLVNSGKFTVLERGSALEILNAEHKFQMSGLVSDESAVGIGHYLGAKVIITGTLSRFADFSQLRIRAIDVRTAQLLTLYTARIQPDDKVLASVMRPLDNVKPPVITENALAYLNRGEDLLREGKYDEAISEFDRALAINKGLTNAYFYRGTAYGLMGEWDKSLADLSEAISISPNSDATVYYNRGIIYFQKNELDKSIADFTSALGISPNDYGSLTNRGRSYNFQGNYFQAIADCNAALIINPSGYEALNNRGEAYRLQRNYGQAIADYNTVLKINPDRYETLNNRGLVYFGQGDYNRALSDYNAALRLKPNQHETLYNRGLLYLQIGEWDRAIVDFEAVLRIDPNDTEAKIQLIIARHMRGDET